MNKEKEIEEMIEVLANKHFEKNPHEYIANMPRAICSALFEAGYRKADEVISEIMKELYSTVCTVGKLCPRDIKQMAKARYGVEVEK